MNFRTTLILIVVLVVVGVIVAIDRFRSKGEGDVATTAPTEEVAAGRKVFADVSADKVSAVTVRPADGEEVALAKAGDGSWLMTKPVQGPADDEQVQKLIKELADLRSRGSVDPSSAPGVDKPAYQVELTSGTTTVKLAVGEKGALGDITYVRVDGADRAEAALVDLHGRLGNLATELPRKELVKLPTGESYSRIEIDRGKAGRVVLQKGDDDTVSPASPFGGGSDGAEWKVVEPQHFPADFSEVSDITSALNRLEAEGFVKPGSREESRTGVDKPQVTVSLTSAPTAPPVPATTQSATKPTTAATAQRAPVEIRFGRYEDIQKRNVYASVTGRAAVAKVPASVLETFQKSPLDLRDRRVINVDPADVAQVTLAIDVAETREPNAKPAVKRQIVLEKQADPGEKFGPEGPPAPKDEAKDAAKGEAKPEEKPADKVDGAKGADEIPGDKVEDDDVDAEADEPEEPAARTPSTTPSTMPDLTPPPPPPAPKWVALEPEGGEVNEQNVEMLLDALHPLRAAKYVESVPATQGQPAGRYVLKVRTQSVEAKDGKPAKPAQEFEVQFTDQGPGGRIVGTYGDLVFEVDKWVIDKMTAELIKPKSEPATKPAEAAKPDEGPASPAEKAQ